jgi:glycosyltransferase involved in cell wall biosynthesis
MRVDISVIIPLYNKEEFIERTLRSVFEQDIANWECIIVDDGSTDSSMERVKDFIKIHPGNWNLVSQENSGQTSARNHGIRLAQGNYLAFLDADDLWLSDKLSSQFNFLQNNPDVFGVVSSYAIFKAGSQDIRVVANDDFGSLLHNWVTMRGFGGGFESVGLIRFTGVPGEAMFDEGLSTSSGLDFSIRCSQLGNMVSLKKIGLLYRISEGQWHSDPKELKLNMAIIASRYSELFNMRLNESHQDYFYWMDARREGSKHFLTRVLVNTAQLRFRRISMLLWLFARNIKASFLGRKNRKFLQGQINLLNA